MKQPLFAGILPVVRELMLRQNIAFIVKNPHLAVSETMLAYTPSESK